MPNPRTAPTAALLAALLATALAAAASVWVHGAEVLSFDEGGKPVYFVLWWPPDDAQWTTLVDYLVERHLYYGVELSGIGLVSLGHGISTSVSYVYELNFLTFYARPLVERGARCFYVYDPSNPLQTSSYFRIELREGYLVWCHAGFISISVYNKSLDYPLWVPVVARSNGAYYKFELVSAHVANLHSPTYVLSERFRVELPEEGAVVVWNAVFPTYFDNAEYVKASGFGLADRLKNHDWRYRFWSVNRSRTAEVWPGSYLVVGIWPNGTVKEWRFAARRPAWIFAYPPARVPEDMAKFLSPGDPNLHSFGRPILTPYYDEEVPNFNDLVGDRGNGTAVLTLVTVPPNSWTNYSIVLLPNGTALYVVWNRRQYFDDLWSNFVDLTYRVIRGMHYKAPVNASRGLRIGVHPRLGSEILLFVRNAWGYWPRGTEGTMLVIFDSGNGTYVAVIYDPVVYRNGTLVIKRYAVPSWTECVNIKAKVTGIEYTNCSLADFFYDEWKFDVTPLRLPWLCPTCLSWSPTFNYTYPAEFAVRVTEIEDMFDPWIEVPGTWPPEWVKREYVLAAKAPTTLSLARAYAGYRAANATGIRLGVGQHYLVVRYLEPTRSYLALVDAVATVRRLVP